jgi:hypothetical protein
MLILIHGQFKSKCKLGSSYEKRSSDDSLVLYRSCLNSQPVWRRVANFSGLYFDNLDRNYILRNDFMLNIFTTSLIWDYNYILTLKHLLKKN